jgi:hypothetical protein
MVAGADWASVTCLVMLTPLVALVDVDLMRPIVLLSGFSAAMQDPDEHLQHTRPVSENFTS